MRDTGISWVDIEHCSMRMGMRIPYNASHYASHLWAEGQAGYGLEGWQP